MHVLYAAVDGFGREAREAAGGAVDAAPASGVGSGSTSSSKITFFYGGHESPPCRAVDEKPPYFSAEAVDRQTEK